MLRIWHVSSLTLEMLLSWENVATMEKILGWSQWSWKDSGTLMVKIAGRFSNVFSKRKVTNCQFSMNWKNCIRSYSTSCKSSKMIKASVLEELKGLYRKIASQESKALGFSKSWYRCNIESWSIKNLFSPCNLSFDSFFCLAVCLSLTTHFSVSKHSNLCKLSLTWNAMT